MMEGILLMLVFCAVFTLCLSAFPSALTLIRRAVLKKRIVFPKPAMRKFQASHKKLFDRGMRAIPILQNLMKRAGVHDQKSIMQFLRLWAGSAFLGLVIAGVLFWGGAWQWYGWLFSLCSLVMGIGCPLVGLMIRVRRRHAVVTLTFPHFLDIMTMALEAGLSEEGALEWLDRKGFGLPPLFLQELHQVRMRKRISTEGAFVWGNCYEIPIVRAYVMMMEQRMRAGVSVAEGLRMLAKEQRQHSLALEETRAETLELKVIPVLLLCMAPPLFVMVLFPVMMRLRALFANDLAFPFL